MGEGRRGEGEKEVEWRKMYSSIKTMKQSSAESSCDCTTLGAPKATETDTFSRGKPSRLCN